MVAIGDIVEVSGRPGKWAVLGRVDNSVQPGRHWRLTRHLKHGLFEGHTAGDGDLTVIERPTFAPGQKVSWEGEDAEVVHDDGGPVVRIKFERARGQGLNREDGTVTFRPMKIDAGRGQLVAENNF